MIPFISGAYGGRNAAQNAQELINWFVETDQRSGKSARFLLPRAGKSLLTTAGTGPIRGMIPYNDLLYVVSGNTFYEIATDGTATSRGTLTTTDGRVSMAHNGPANGKQIIIVDGTAGWIFDSDAVTFTQITDANFQNNARTVTFQDSYFIIEKPDSGRFYISNQYDGATWTTSGAPDFATAEGEPDNLVAVINDRRNLWLIGTDTTEVFYNSGDNDFPFALAQQGYIDKGCIAPFTVKQVDNSLMWLSKDKRGDLQVIRMDGFTPVVISTKRQSDLFREYSNPDEAFAYVYQDRGHEFYVLTFPHADVTWAFDASEGEWCKLSYWDHQHSRDRGNCHAFFNSKHYVGDWEDGKIYEVDPDVYTDNGDAIVRDNISPHITSDEGRIFFSEVQVKFEQGTGLQSGQGSDPICSIRWSKDGGNTWGAWKETYIGQVGKYANRARVLRLGQSYDWTFHIRVSDPIKAVVLNAFAKTRKADAEK